MTVCIAAICHWGNHPLIVAASDQMITAGDIEFEPTQTKAFQMDHAVLALVAGDTHAQTEVCQRTFEKIVQPSSTRGIVDIYCRELAAYNRRQGERSILEPLGLNMQSFVGNQEGMSSEFIDTIYCKLERERAEVETIISGVDAQGAHIYVVDRSMRAVCNDAVGFAAIGVGEWHAESQFMFARYTRFWPIARALLLTYTAKRRAEVAPGVGKETNMHSISKTGGSVPINEHVMTELKKIYEELRLEQNGIIEKSNKRVEEFVHQLQQSGVSQEQQSPAGPPQQPIESSESTEKNQESHAE